MRLPRRITNWMNRLDRALLVYIGLAVAILGPLLKPGYILTLDMVVAPEWRWPTSLTSNYPLLGLLHLLNRLLPADLLQKILLMTIFVLAGYGLHRLVRDLNETQASHWPAYFGGMLFVVNPFTYARFMAGQWAVLFGLALLPWLVRSLRQFFARPGQGSAIRLAAWGTAIAVVSIHTVGIAALVVLLVAVVRLRYWQQWWRWAAGAAGLWLAMQSYWLLPTLLGRNDTAGALASFGPADYRAFATGGGDVLSRLMATLHLQGFWLERYGLFILPQHSVSSLVWWLVYGVIAWLILAGLVYWWRGGRRGEAAVFGLMIVVGACLAAGIGIGPLASRLPLLAGYREPHKFAMLVVLAYAVLASLGAARFKRWSGRWPTVTVGVPPALLALPLLWTPTMLWGASRQLAAAHYPASWYAINRQINRDPGDVKVLFVPWHMYLFTDFAGRIIANPAPLFFDKQVIVSHDPEFRGAAASYQTRAEQNLAAAMQLAARESFVPELRRQGIRYVVFARQSDYQKYDWLRGQAGLQRIGVYRDAELYRLR